MLLSTHSYLLVGESRGGGESVSVVLWGFAAMALLGQSSSRAATPEGSLHKSRVDSVVCAYLWATEEMLCTMFVNVTTGAEW